MKALELFEGVRNETGDDVYLSMRPGYGDSLTINIDYRTITQANKEDEGFQEQRYRARRAARTNPELEKAMEAWEDKISAFEKETEQEIIQLVGAYKNMVYGLLTLAHKKLMEDWEQNIMTNVPPADDGTFGGNNA